MSEARPPDERIGQYRLARQLGQGGMGVVYEAVHDEIGRRAAVKVLSPRCAGDPMYVRRFLNEARTISRVRHPGLVQIYDFGQTASGAPYILMELLEGETLRERLVRRGRPGTGALLSPAEMRRVVRQIAAALARTHDEGIVHRDLKPENVMLVADEEAPGGERVKLLDFGIARFVDERNPALTAPGSTLGTAAYMSPEQCAGEEELGPASDVYALGVMLYELIAGAPPFEGSTASAIMRKQILDDPPPLPASAPPELTGLAARMLAKEPTRRPSMRDVAEALAEPAAKAAAPARASIDALAATEPRESLGNAGGVDAGGTPASTAATAALAAPAPTPATATPATATPAAPVPTPATTTPAPPAAPAAATPTAVTANARPPRRPRRARWIAAGLALAGCAAAWPIYRAVRGSSSSPSAATPPPAIAGMVWFPGGRFRMGRTADELDAECKRLGATCKREQLDREQPAREVTISPFYLDELEATNAEVARWLTTLSPSIEMRTDDEHRLLRWAYLDGRRLVDLMPPHAGIERDADGGFRARPGQERKPAVQLTWDGAQLYCKSRGKRLPTEAEWELAARGHTVRRFPWGDQEVGCADVIWGREDGKPCAAAAAASGGAGPMPVGTAPLDRTPEGVRDMGGNVMEWVQDQFRQPYYPPCGTCVDPVVDAPSPAEEDMRVLRGGSWVTPLHMSRSTMRARWKRIEVMVNAGVRCASR